MRKTLILLAAAFFLVAGASAAEWTETTHSTYESYEELQELYHGQNSINGTVVNDSGGFISLTGSEANIAFNSSLYGGIEEIDGVRFQVEVPDPVNSDASTMIKQTSDGTPTGTVSANLSASLTDGENTFYQEDMKEQNGYTDPNTFSAIAVFLEAGDISSENYPKITAVTFLERERPVVYNTSNLTVEGSWTSEAFTADSLKDFSADVSLGENTSLSATLTGYNSTAETGNQTWDIKNGSHSLSIQTFSENTSTYTLELESSNGSATINNIEIAGVTAEDSVSGAAPGGGGLFTGNFFAGIPGISEAATAVGNFFTNLFTGIETFLGGLIPW